MWCVVLNFDGRSDIHGPFPNEDRANRYRHAAIEEYKYTPAEPLLLRTEVCPLTVPYSVVRSISWRPYD